MRRELSNGLSVLAELIAFDLQQDVDLKAKDPRTLVRRDGDRAVFRNNKGPLPGTLSSEPTNYMRPQANTAEYSRH